VTGTGTAAGATVTSAWHLTQTYVRRFSFQC
jgi:hypothetical protein